MVQAEKYELCRVSSACGTEVQTRETNFATSTLWQRWVCFHCMRPSGAWRRLASLQGMISGREEHHTSAHPGQSASVQSVIIAIAELSRGLSENVTSCQRYISGSRDAIHDPVKWLQQCQRCRTREVGVSLGFWSDNLCSAIQRTYHIFGPF